MAEGLNVMEIFASLGLEVNEHDFERANELIETIHHAMEAFAIFEGVEWLKELFKSTEEEAIAASHLSQRLGIATDDIQKLGYAADISGASHEAMTAGLQRMSMGLEMARKKGTGPFADGIQKLGLSMDDPVLKSGNLNAVTLRVADAFKNATPQMNKTAAGMEILGKHGTVLIPMFNQGSEGIKAMGDELEDLGGVKSEETIKSFEELERSQKRLKASWHALVTNAVTALIPEIKEITEGMVAWVKANKDLIKQRLEQIFHALVVVLKGVITVVGLVLDVFGFLVEHARLIALVLAEVTVAIVVMKREAIIAGAKMFLAWLRAFAPLIAVVGLLTLIGLAIDDVIGYMNGEDSVTGRFLSQIDGGIDRIIGGFKAAGQAILDFFVDLPGTIWGYFKDFVGLIVGLFKKGITDIGELFVDIFRAIFDWIAGKITAIWDNIKSAGRAVKDFFVGDVANTKETQQFRAAFGLGGGEESVAGAQAVAAGTPWFLPSGPGGAAAGPMSTTNNTATTGPHVQAQINVQIPPGANAEEYGRSVATAFERFWTDKVREFSNVSGAKATP